MNFSLQRGLDERLFKLMNRLYRPFLSTRHLKDRFQFTVFCDEVPFPIGIVSINKGSDTFMQIALIPELRGRSAGHAIVELAVHETGLAKVGWTCEKNNYPSLKTLVSLGGGVFESSVRQSSKKTYEGFFYADKKVSRKMHAFALDALDDAKTRYVEWIRSEYSARTDDLIALRRYLLESVSPIDMHCHCVTSSARQSGMLNEGVLKRMPYRPSLLPVSRRVVFGVPDSCCDLKKVNDEILESCSSDQSLVPAAVLHDGINLAEMFNKGVFLFKEHVYGQRLLRNDKGEECLASSERIKLYRELARYGAILISHMGPNLVPRITDIVEKVPELTIIVAHLGSPMNRDKSWDLILDDLKKLAVYRNVLFDVSAVGDIHAIEAAIEILSSERLVWGSDYPWEPPDVSMQRLINDPKISVMDLFNVFSQTATSLLKRINGSVARSG